MSSPPPPERHPRASSRPAAPPRRTPRSQGPGLAGRHTHRRRRPPPPAPPRPRDTCAGWARCNRLRSRAARESLRCRPSGRPSPSPNARQTSRRLRRIKREGLGGRGGAVDVGEAKVKAPGQGVSAARPRRSLTKNLRWLRVQAPATKSRRARMGLLDEEQTSGAEQTQAASRTRRSRTLATAGTASTCRHRHPDRYRMSHSFNKASASGWERGGARSAEHNAEGARTHAHRDGIDDGPSRRRRSRGHDRQCLAGSAGGSSAAQTPTGVGRSLTRLMRRAPARVIPRSSRIPATPTWRRRIGRRRVAGVEVVTERHAGGRRHGAVAATTAWLTCWTTRMPRLSWAYGVAGSRTPVGPPLLRVVPPHRVGQRPYAAGAPRPCATMHHPPCRRAGVKPR